MLYELLNLGLVHSEIPHHHSRVVAESQYHEPLLGFGNDTRVMMRDFRVDEPEIEEFIEHWRRLIASKNCALYCCIFLPRILHDTK